MIRRIVVLALLSITSFAAAVAAEHRDDRDADGLDDALEQALLERFQPRFFLSRDECDDRPAEFIAGRLVPSPAARNGTIYGQAFPIVRVERSRALIELHYYHLWARDCGQRGHPLDAEHVSALVQADAMNSGAGQWTAKYWYAAAHQETVCDASHGTRAETIEATTSGASIWISRAKHASFLRREMCSWGCGGDRCKDPVPLVSPAIVNLGEAQAPLNGASWIAAPGWPLAAHMGSDFPEEILAKLDAAKPDEIISLNTASTPFKAFVLGTGSAASGLARGRDETGNAFGRALRAIGRAFKAAVTFHWKDDR